MDTTEEHFEGKIALKAIVVKDNKVLLVQDPRGGKDTWEIPGGRMNVDEDPREAIDREFFEEMGVHIDVHEVVYMEQFLQGNENARAFVIVFAATLTDPTLPFNVATQEVSAVEWFTKEQVSKLKLYPEYDRALEIYFKTITS